MNDLIIVGGGPAGISAAVYALRAGIDTLILEREFYGGKMNYTNEISNYPGFINISGIKLAENMFNCAKNLGVNFEYADIISSNLSNDIKVLISSNGKEYLCKSLIIATGLKTRYLKCKGEEKFKGLGVSYCATCDGFFFKNKKVIVVGGGNTALEDALYLSGICKEVILVVRKKFFRGDKILSDSLKNHDNIKIMFETVIIEILGDKKVKKVILNNKNNEKKEILIDAVFIAIGQEPANNAFSEISSNNLGYFSSDESCITNIEGVYVAGDCREKNLRQIVTAVSDGAVAATESVKFIKNYKFKYAHARN